MKLGIIGCGYWGPKCVRALKSVTGAELEWIADADASTLETYRKEGYKVTTKYHDILRDETITGVLVLTPASSHYTIIKDCLKAGKHVFVEKPLTTSSADAKKLITLAEFKKVKLMTGHIYLFHPAIQYIKEAMRRRDLKPPLHFHFQRRSPGPVRKDVNVLWDLGPHEVSIMAHLTGSTPTSISSLGMDIHGHGHPDIVTVNLAFKKGITSSMVFSWIDPIKIRDLTIISRRKTLVFNDMAKEKVMIYDTTKARPDSGMQPEVLPIAAQIPTIEPLREELQHFVDCLNSGSNPLVSGHDGLAVVQILENIEKSMKRKTLNK